MTSSDGEQPKIPEDLRVLYDLARLSGESNIQILIERIARLEQPVSDEEQYMFGCITTRGNAFTRAGVDLLIAARKVQP